MSSACIGRFEIASSARRIPGNCSAENRAAMVNDPAPISLAKCFEDMIVLVGLFNQIGGIAFKV
jgi:hypothetical protein